MTVYANYLFERSKQRLKRITFFEKGLTIASFFGSLIATFLAILDFEFLGLNAFGRFVLIASAGVLLGYVLFDFISAKENDRGYKTAERWPIDFDCPLCEETINVAQPWMCGTCRQRFESDRDNTVFMGCPNDACKPHPQLPRHQQIAGVICPSCRGIIPLNGALMANLDDTKGGTPIGVAKFLPTPPDPPAPKLPPLHKPKTQKDKIKDVFDDI